MIIKADNNDSVKEVVNLGTENRDVSDINDVDLLQLIANNDNISESSNTFEENLQNLINSSNTNHNTNTVREHSSRSSDLIKVEDVNTQVNLLYNKVMDISNRLGELEALRTMFRLLAKAGVGTTRSEHIAKDLYF